MSEPTSTLDRIISDAIEKAKSDAIYAVFGAAQNDTVVAGMIRDAVIAHLRTPEGHAKIVALADKALAGLTARKGGY